MYLHTTLALCSLFVVLIGSQVAAGVTPLDSTRWLSSPILIDDKALGANMIVRGDNVYFTWPSPAIMFSGSTDGGNTFSRPISIAFDPLNGYLSINPAPQIAAINDSVYVVYTTGKDIYLIRSNNEGQTFFEPVNVSRMNLEEGSDAIIAGHTIAAVGDRVDVAWVVSSATWIEVFFAQSMDGGRTFGDHINVSNNPDLAANSLKIISKVNEVYLVWEEWDANNIQHISFARSDDGGEFPHNN